LTRLETRRRGTLRVIRGTGTTDDQPVARRINHNTAIAAIAIKTQDMLGIITLILEGGPNEYLMLNPLIRMGFILPMIKLIEGQSKLAAFARLRNEFNPTNLRFWFSTT
jgi:hypothetical protein